MAQILSIKLKGVEKMTANLHKILLSSKINANKGLINCAIKLRRDMENKFPKIPVDFRNLGASWYAVTIKNGIGQSGSFSGKESGEMASDHSSAVATARSMVSGRKNPAMVMGFSANYAAAVHEMSYSSNWSRPGSGPKYFESHLIGNQKDFLLILKNSINLNKSR